MSEAKLILPNETPLVFQRSVAEAFGLQEAIVLQQLYYLIHHKGLGRVRDGKRWVFYTYEAWQKEFFPFWSVQTLQRIFAKLEALKIVESRQFDGGISRRKYYHLPSGIVEQLRMPPSFDNE